MEGGVNAEFHPINDVIEAETVIGFDEEVDLAASVVISADVGFLLFIVFGRHQLVGDEFAESFMGIATEGPFTGTGHVFEYPGV